MSDPDLFNTTTSQGAHRASVDESVPSPSQNSAPNLSNPRSCVTCRRRKVRCDKKHPCNNCLKAGIDCVFPGPGRAPRKPRKPQDTELLSRLRRLEGVVQALGAQVDEEVTDLTTERRTSPTTTPPTTARDSFCDADPKKQVQRAFDKEFGRLVIDGGGRSRYMSHSFYTHVGDEVAELRELLEGSTSEDEQYPSPDQSGSGSTATNHQAFLFGYSAAAGNLRNLHPTPTQIFILFKTFKENVDPVVKIFHRPSLSKILLGAATSVDNLSKVHEAVLFSVFFAAVTSLTHQQCRQLLNEDREALLNKYRFATEQAQARAGFLNSSNLMLLQAFVLFLICVRRHDTSRFVWAMSGIAVRNAVAIGVHRDGTNFGLSPFETEIRRRLWWHICLLDLRSTEDQGADPSVFEHIYDTRLPLNINDSDISPEMKAFPREREGFTEMTFCLIRFEISVSTRRLTYVPAGSSPCPTGASSRTIEEKQQLLNTLQRRIEERYLQYCDMTVPIEWVVSTVGRLVIAKLWLLIHQPLHREDKGQGLTPQLRDKLLSISTEVLEFTRLLETNENTAKWEWLFHTYSQWYAVAFLLTELIVRQSGPEVDRAWRAVDTVYGPWAAETSRARKHTLWRPLRSLMDKALAVREKQNEAKRAQWAMPVTMPPTIESINGIQESMPLFGSPSQRDVLGTTALALGLDINSREMWQSTVNNVSAAPSQALPPEQGVAQDATPAQRNLSDAEINQWLATEPAPLQTSDTHVDFPGWDEIVSDFQMGGMESLPSSLNNITDWV